MARASALQAEGQGFESPYLQKEEHRKVFFFIWRGRRTRDPPRERNEVRVHQFESPYLIPLVGITNPKRVTHIGVSVRDYTEK